MAGIGEREAHQVGRAIALVREEQGLSRRALARQVGIGHTSLRKIELGLSNPSLYILARVAQALRVDLWQLMQPGVPWLRLMAPWSLGEDLGQWRGQFARLRGIIDAGNDYGSVLGAS